MKKILFDLLCSQPAVDSKYHGGGEYVKTVFEHLVKKHHNIDAEIVVFYDENRFIDDWILEMISDYKIETYSIAEEADFVFLFEKTNFDVFYAGMSFVFDHSLVPKNVKKVCTVHDLRNYEEPIDRYAYVYCNNPIQQIKQLGKMVTEQYLRRRNLQRYYTRLKGFDTCVCVSEHTKYMVKSAMPEMCEKCNAVMYTPSKHYQDGKRPKGFKEENYILMVSANRWLKNCYRALVAIDNLYDKGLISNKTVLTGELPSNIIRRLRHKEMYITLDYVDSNELEYLYKSCEMLLYPTLNEGFGMPPLEAMRYGKTCVMSGICSLVELYAGAAYFMNPYKVEEIENRVLMALENPIKKEVVIEKFEAISKRQKDDLERLAQILIE